MLQGHCFDFRLDTFHLKINHAKFQLNLLFQLLEFLWWWVVVVVDPDALPSSSPSFIVTASEREQLTLTSRSEVTK